MTGPEGAGATTGAAEAAEFVVVRSAGGSDAGFAKAAGGRGGSFRVLGGRGGGCPASLSASPPLTSREECAQSW